MPDTRFANMTYLEANILMQGSLYMHLEKFSTDEQIRFLKVLSSKSYPLSCERS